MLDHKFYVELGLEKIKQGLDALKTSQEESGNVLMAAIIHNIEAQISFFDPDAKHQLF